MTRYHYYASQWLGRGQPFDSMPNDMGFHNLWRPQSRAEFYPPTLEKRWIKYNKWNHDSCVLCLPGRGNHGQELASAYKRQGVKSFIVGITPTIRSWYPMPNGINDQEEAVKGVMPAMAVIEEVLKLIENKRGIPRNRIVLVGHSAGAVMAIMTAVMSPTPFAGVISHNGAILDPEAVPQCNCPDTPFFLAHSRDDLIFEWQERFIPMFTALKNKGYKIYTDIEKDAGHCVTRRQFQIGKYLIEACLKQPTSP
ncbi:MAG: alpha/beta hydrolase [Proteobacteria bacterium]|jgi:predicted esterase|nr:alpha/beta hydrolase [Pseudomonadota bacterium]